MAAVSKPGLKNLITDIAGLKVGNASDEYLKTGTTVLVGEAPFTASVHVMGGAPGTKETDLLAPDKNTRFWPRVFFLILELKDHVSYNKLIATLIRA